jgi:hypothetical protein
MEGWMIRFAEMAFPELDSSSSYVRRLRPADSVVKVRTIRFGGLPFVFASREGQRTDAVKPRVIRFVEISAFSGVQ